MARAGGGESVRGYKLLRDFKMAGGGNCEWTFAVKDGKEYFIKRFLNPKYPRVDGPGSEKVKTQMRQECDRFEKHQRDLNDAVKRGAGAGGRLVAAADFFREDNLFYKVAVKVPAATITPADIARLPFAEKIRLLQNVCTAVSTLHNQRIVHGDLKIDNALLEKSSGDEPFIARLIDFDSSYFSQKPPIVDEMMGDPPYYSPELLNYVQERDDDPSKMTIQSDLFALGLVFHQYLAGEMPNVSGEHSYLCEAVRAGYVVTPDSLDKIQPVGMRNLIASMLQFNFSDRPTAFAIQNQLREMRTRPDFVPVADDVKKDKTKTPVEEKKGALRIPKDSGTTPTTVSPDETKIPVARPGLRGRLIAADKSEVKASDSGSTPTIEHSGGTKTPVEEKKGALRIPKPEKKESSLGEGVPHKSVETDGADIDEGKGKTAAKVDLELPSRYKVVVEKLIESLTAVDSAVLAKVSPPRAPTRIKGTMAREVISLIPSEIETIEDITHRLADLQKHADEVTKWLKGDSSERPSLRITVSDLVVEVTIAADDVTVATDLDAPEPVVVTGVDSEGKLETAVSVGEVSVAVEIDVVGDMHPIETSESIEDKLVTDIREAADVSGSHRREERLKKRDGFTRS